MICSICKSPITSNEETIKCGNCQNEFHLDCWNENGGCGIPGCSNVPTIKKKLGETTKVCPACGEKINLDVLTCPFCNESFETIAPLTSDELKGKYSPKRSVPKQAKGAIWVLIFGLIGITAPFNLIFGGIWYSQNKKILKEEYRSDFYRYFSKTMKSISR